MSCVYTTTDPPGIRLFLRLPASRTSPDTRPLSKEERWHWSHSGVKVTFFHRTWRSHRLPHTPYLCSFFIVHSHYISFVSLLFSLFLSFARLNVDPLLDQSCFVRDFLIMGADWRYLSDTELYYFGAHEVGTKLSFDLLVFHCFKGFIFFIKLHWKSEVVWLDVQFEVVVSRGHYMNVSDHKHWLQRAKTEDTSACLWTFYQRVTWRAGYVQIFSECFSWLRFF